MLTRAVRIDQRGGPEVMRFDEVEIGDPGPGEVRIRQTAMASTSTNRVTAKARDWRPATNTHADDPRNQGAGVIEKVGPGVGRSTKATASPTGSPPGGSYTDRRNYPVARLVKLPAEVSEETAARIC